DTPSISFLVLYDIDQEADSLPTPSGAGSMDIASQPLPLNDVPLYLVQVILDTHPYTTWVEVYMVDSIIDGAEASPPSDRDTPSVSTVSSVSMSPAAIPRGIETPISLSLSDSEGGVVGGGGEGEGLVVEVDGESHTATWDTTAESYTVSLTLWEDSSLSATYAGESVYTDTLYTHTPFLRAYDLPSLSTTSEGDMTGSSVSISGEWVAVAVSERSPSGCVVMYKMNGESGDYEYHSGIFMPTVLGEMQISDLALHGNWIAISLVNADPDVSDDRVGLWRYQLVPYADGDEWVWYKEGYIVSDSWMSGSGMGVDISSDGTTLVVGQDMASTYTGRPKVSVYTLTETEWEDGGVYVITPSLAYDTEGYGHVVSVDGDVLVVGTTGDIGYAYVYERDASTGEWEEVSVLTSGLEGRNYGYSMAVSGGVVAVGEPYFDRILVSGLVYIYTRVDGVYTETFVLGEIGNSYFEYNRGFGSSIALEGRVIAITYYYGTCLFQCVPGQEWSEVFRIQTGSGPNQSVSVLGSSFVIGTPPYSDDDSHVTVMSSDLALAYPQQVAAGYSRLYVPRYDLTAEMFTYLRVAGLTDQWLMTLSDSEASAYQMHNPDYAYFSIEQVGQYMPLWYMIPQFYSSYDPYVYRPDMLMPIEVVYGPAVTVWADSVTDTAVSVHLYLVNAGGVRVADEGRVVRVARVYGGTTTAVYSATCRCYVAGIGVFDTPGMHTITVTDEGVETDLDVYVCDSSTLGAVTPTLSRYDLPVMSETDLHVHLTDMYGYTVGGWDLTLAVAVLKDGSEAQTQQGLWDTDAGAYIVPLCLPLGMSEIRVTVGGIVIGSLTVTGSTPYTRVSELEAPPLEGEEAPPLDSWYGSSVALSGEWAAVVAANYDEDGKVFLYHYDNGVWQYRQTLLHTPITVALSGEWLLIISKAQRWWLYRLYSGTEGEEPKWVEHINNVTPMWSDLDYNWTCPALSDEAFVIMQLSTKTSTLGYVVKEKQPDSQWDYCHTQLPSGWEDPDDVTGISADIDGKVFALGVVGVSFGSVRVYEKCHPEGYSDNWFCPVLQVVTDTPLGTAVAISGDTCAVGEPSETGPEGEASVWVYTRTGDGDSPWVVGQRLVGSGGFGSSLAMGDGYIAVGTQNRRPLLDPSKTPGNGSLYVYHLDTDGVWQQVWSAEGKVDGGLLGMDMSMDAGHLIAGSGPMMERAIAFECDWADSDAVGVSAGAGYAGVEVTMSDVSDYTDVDAASGLTVSGLSDRGEFSLIAQDQTLLGWTGNEEWDWMAPGETVHVSVAGLEYQSETVALGGAYIVQLDAPVTAGLPGLIVTDTLPESESESGREGLEVKDTDTYLYVTGVALDVSSLPYDEGAQVQVTLGQDSVTLPATVTTSDASDASVSAVLSTPYPIPSSWQRGAQGALLPVPIAVSDGVARVTGTGWLQGSPEAAVPKRGSVTDQHFASVMGRGECAQVDIALFDEDKRAVSCGTAGVGFGQQSMSDKEQHFLYPLTDNGCTLVFCIADNSPVNTRIAIKYEGRNVMVIPVTVGTVAVRFISTVVLVLLGVTVLIAIGTASSDSQSMPPPKRRLGERETEGVEEPSLEATMALSASVPIEDIHSHTPGPMAVETQPEQWPSPMDRTGVSVSVSTPRGAAWWVVALDIGVFSVIKVFMLASNFYVVMRFTGFFTTVQISDALLDRYPIIKWGIVMAQFLDNTLTALIQWVVDRDVSPPVFCTVYGMGSVLIVVVAFCNWGLSFIQEFLSLKTRIWVYLLFFAFNLGSEVAASVLTDVSMWYIVAGSGGMGREVAIVCFVVMLAVTFSLVAFVGDEYAVLYSFVTGDWKSLRKMALSLMRRLLSVPIPVAYPGNDAPKDGLGTIFLSWLVTVLLSPVFLCHVLFTPVTSSFLYVLQSVSGVYAPPSLAVERWSHRVMCAAIIGCISLTGFTICPWATGTVIVSLLSSIGMTHVLHTETRFDPFAMSLLRIDSINQRLADTSIDPARLDWTEAERFIEMNLTLRNSAFLVIPLVGPVLVIVADLLCSPPLRYPGVHPSRFNWTTNLVSAVCLFGMVLGDSVRVLDVAVGVFGVMQVYDVSQEGRVIAQYVRWDPLAKVKARAGDRRQQRRAKRVTKATAKDENKRMAKSQKETQRKAPKPKAPKVPKQTRKTRKMTEREKRQRETARDRALAIIIPATPVRPARPPPLRPATPVRPPPMSASVARGGSTSMSGTYSSTPSGRAALSLSVPVPPSDWTGYAEDEPVVPVTAYAASPHALRIDAYSPAFIGDDASPRWAGSESLAPRPPTSRPSSSATVYSASVYDRPSSPRPPYRPSRPPPRIPTRPAPRPGGQRYDSAV
ncbi:hypothetical protein KIPB_006283, partial [Kipferlia bialata]